jgi:hypothetical protein
MLALAILATVETAIIIGLWFFCGWIPDARKSRVLLKLSVVLILFCLGLVCWFLIFNHAAPWRSDIPRSLVEDLVFPCYLLFPFAVGFCCSRYLASRSRSTKTIRRVSFVMAVIALLLTPFLLIIAGCGMAGTCF